MSPRPALSGLFSSGCLVLGLLSLVGPWALGREAPRPGPDIYVAGSEDNVRPTATIWESGQPAALGQGPKCVRPLAMSLSGQDLYEAGWQEAPSIPQGNRARPVRIAMVWKNGAGTRLTRGNTWAVAMAVKVAGRDVYVAGSDEERATLWKNGQEIPLGPQGVRSWARALALSGTDVLAAGNAWSSPDNTEVAMLWRNGEAMPLTDGTYPACATAITVAGADVHVAGYESNGRVKVAKIWKNGKALPPLSDGSRDAEAEAVAVEGATVIAAGHEAVGASLTDGGGEDDVQMPVATVWKNGRPIRLADGTRFSWAHSVALAGTEIYAAGEELVSSDPGQSTAHATLWRVGADGWSGPASAAAAPSPCCRRLRELPPGLRGGPAVVPEKLDLAGPGLIPLPSPAVRCPAETP